MPPQAFLRRTGVIRTGDEIAIDRPGLDCGETLRQLARVAAAEAEIDRQTPAYDVCDDVDEALRLVVIEGQGLAGRTGEDEPTDRALGIVAHELCERRLVELPIMKRRDQRQPDAGKRRCAAGCRCVGHLPFSWLRKPPIGSEG
jgi:hypothetical protein